MNSKQSIQNIHQLCALIMIVVETGASQVIFKPLSLKAVYKWCSHKILTVLAQLGHVRCGL